MTTIAAWIAVFLAVIPVSSSKALEPTRADIEEAFLLWATPKAEYSGRAQEEAYALLTADSASAALILPKFLSSPSGSIRDKVLTLCENIGAAAVGPAFRPHAGPDSPYLTLVMYCLSRSGDTESLPIILSHLKHPRPAVRSPAALSLGYIGRPEAVDSLIETLRTDTLSAVRKSAVFAIGRCLDTPAEDGAAMSAVIAALDDHFFSVRFNAVRALARWNEPAVGRIAQVFDSMSDTAKFGALQVMGRAATGRGRPFLEKIAADPSAPMTVRGSALKSLLDRQWMPADTDLADLRASPIGRGLFGLIR